MSPVWIWPLSWPFPPPPPPPKFADLLLWPAFPRWPPPEPTDQPPGTEGCPHLPSYLSASYLTLTTRGHILHLVWKYLAAIAMPTVCLPTFPHTPRAPCVSNAAFARAFLSRCTYHDNTWTLQAGLDSSRHPILGPPGQDLDCPGVVGDDQTPR